MTADTKPVLDRLRDRLRDSLIYEGKIEEDYMRGLEDAVAAALAALARPQPVAVESGEPSDAELVSKIAVVLAHQMGYTGNNYDGPFGNRARQILAVVDLAPREAAAYARGIEDAAKVIDRETGMAISPQAAAWLIRDMLPKEPATEKPNADR
jgi:hypothetical protein